MLLYLLLMYDFWSLTQSVQDQVAALVPKKDSWTLKLFKQDNSDWTFSIALIKDEALCNGTEKVIDYYFKQLNGKSPETKDSINMTVSTTKPDEYLYTTKLEYDGPDGAMQGSNNYTDVNTGKTVWLCPVLQVMFGTVPPVLYVKFS